MLRPECAFKPRGGISEAHFILNVSSLVKDVVQEIVEFPFPRMLPSKSSFALFFVLPKAKFGSLCAFQAAFHEHLKTAAFVDAVGLGLSNLVPKCQEADGNQKGTETTSLI